MEKETKKGRASVKTVIKSILSGDILILMRVDRILPYILFLFVLGWVNIFLNYSIEQTMVKVEKNKKVMENYRNDYANKTLWNRKSLINIAASGQFAADRSIEEYAQRIWNLKKIPNPTQK